MSKFLAVVIVIAMVAACYLVMLVLMPVINTMVQTANSTITSSGVNITAMPGSQSGLLVMPWIIWWIPGTISMFIIVAILKHK